MMRLFLLLSLIAFSLATPVNLAAQAVDAGQATRALLPSNSGCGGSGAAVMRANQEGGHGFDLTDLDRTVPPCSDFYQFVNGGWLKKNPIPAEFPAWGVAQKLAETNQEVLHKILEEAAKDKNAATGSNWQKIGDFYASCMDEGQVEAAGLKPLESELARIGRIKDVSGLQDEIAQLHVRGVRALFVFNSDQDAKDSSQVIAEANQGGLGLPDRDYYTREDEQSKKLRDMYVEHVAKMFKLAGDEDSTAASEAKKVLSIETLLAKASMEPVDLRDPQKIYNKMTLTQVHELTPHFSWEQYLRQAGSPAVASMNVAQPEFFKAVNAAFMSVPGDDWKIYLRWHLIHAFARTLPAKFVEEDFSFFGRTLTGSKEMLPRWRRCVAETDSELGEALGEYFVKQRFSPEAKAKARLLVTNLMAALRDDLATLDWMSPATREKALAKLSTINVKVGYPDKWRDYSAFKVDRGSYAGNALRGAEFAFAYDVAKIGKPVNRLDWDMTPPTVNAYYSDHLNEVVFPAGILQPPLFDPDRDDAMNYGDMGATIGHELTHGFDDEGSQFDAQGNLKNWWTPEDLKNFQARGECVAKQFDEFEVEPGLHENGKLEEGESIADLGGLVIAYAAFRTTLKGKPEPPPIDGFTADQRFFISYAQTWADNFRPEYARLIAQTNEHPIDRFRTLGPLANMQEFAKAFACAAGSAMVRPEAKRCRVW
jgi:putative endopeptidase